MARWFMEKHPRYSGFFELRESPHSNGEGADDDEYA
jgi:hypothetical protein